jgi:hypothetical protein
VPTVHRERGFEFFFYSQERQEAPHIHVQSGDGYAKMWLGPPVLVAYSYGLSPRERRAAVEIAVRERAMMEKAWHDHFGT